MDEVDNGPKCICKRDVPEGHSVEECDWPIIKNKKCPVHNVIDEQKVH